MSEMYRSLQELREEHKKLRSQSQEASGYSQETLAAAKLFVERAAATGRRIGDDKDRWLLQSYLDFWVAEIESAGEKMQGSGRLAPFDLAATPELPPSACPYPGIDPYQSQDAPRFFGRHELVQELLTRLADPGQRLLILRGAAASGKTSLLQAGLLPVLQQVEGAAPPTLSTLPIVVPGRDPLASLARWLSKDPSDSKRPEAPADPAAGDTDVDAMKAALLAAHRDRPCLFVVDQLEDLFTLCPSPRSCAGFLDVLRALADSDAPRHKVLISLRSEYTNQLRTFRSFAKRIETGSVVVRPLKQTELREAIEQPAQRVGLQLDTELVDLLIADVRDEPVALPLLQFLLRQLYDRRERSYISRDSYTTRGRAALPEWAEHQKAELGPAWPTAWQLLLRLGSGHSEGDAEGALRRHTRAELALDFVVPAEVDRVLARLVGAQLIKRTPRPQPQDVQYELSHPALLTDWTLGIALAQQRERRDARNRLIGVSAALGVVTLLLALCASLYGLKQKAYKQEQAAKKWAEREMKTAQEARRQSEKSQRLACREAKRAVLKSGLLGARLLHGADPQKALLMLKEVLGQQRAEPARAEIRKDLYEYLIGVKPHSRLGAQGKRVLDIALSERGDRLLTVEEGGTVRTYDASGRQLSESATRAPLQRATFSPDGSLVLAIARQGRALLWPPGQLPPALLPHSPRELLAGAVFSPDRQHILTYTTAGAIYLWTYQVLAKDSIQVEGPRLLRVLNQVAGTAASFLPVSGDSILVTDNDRTAHLYPLKGTPQALVSRSPITELRGGMFSSQGTLIATFDGADPGAVQLFTREGKERCPRLLRTDTPEPQSPTGGQLAGVAFSPDEKRLAAYYANGMVRVFNTADCKAQRAAWSAHRKPVTGASFVGGSDKLLTYSAEDREQPARIWSLAAARSEMPPAVSLRELKAGVSKALIDPQGTFVVTLSSAGEVNLWTPRWRPLSETAAIARLHAHQSLVLAAAFDPSRADRIVSGASDHTAYQWRLQGRSWEPSQLQPGTPIGAVLQTIFSSDGKRLLTTTTDGAAQIWDQQGKLLCRLSTAPHNTIFTAVGALAPGGQHAVVVVDSSAPKLWRVPTDEAEPRACELLRELPVQHSERPVVTFAPDGQSFLVATAEKTVQRFALDGTLLATSAAHGGEVMDAVFCPDGSCFYTAARDGLARKWSADGKLLFELSGHLAAVNKIAVSRDGERVLTVSWDSAAVLWKKDGSQIKRLRGHQGPLRQALFSPDGKMMLTVPFMGPSRLWDAQRGELFAELPARSETLGAGVFSVDGRWLLTLCEPSDSAAANDLCVLPANGEALDAAIGIAVPPDRVLSEQDWIQYLGRPNQPADEDPCAPGKDPGAPLSPPR